MTAAAARDAARRFARSLAERNMLEAAGSIAFRFFLSTVPLLVFVGFVLGRLARARGVEQLVDPLADVAPAVTDDLLRTELLRLARADAPALAPLSVVGFLWMSSSGAHNLLNVFAMVFRARPRPWLRQRLVALGWTLLALALTVGALWARAAADLALHPASAHPLASIVRPAAVRQAWARAGLQRRELGPRRRVLYRVPRPDAERWRAPMLAPPQRPRPPRPSQAAPPPTAPPADEGVPLRPAQRSPWEHAAWFAMVLGLGTGVLAGFYRYAIARETRARRRVWTGALVAVAAWLVVSWAFGAYVSSLERYAVYYGSLAAVAVLQIWLFLTSLMMLLGAQVNEQLDEAAGGAP